VGSGSETMKYSMPSSPAVVDIDHDGFADLAYIGDSSGQMWKWDISPVGENTVGDARMDNWPFAIFFKSAPVVLGTGRTHYRSMYAPAAVAYVDGVLTVAFGTGERRDTLFAGDVLKDENNRFYVLRDSSPTGWTTPLVALTEATLTDITSDAVYTPPVGGDDGFYFVAPDGEKFFNDPLVFASHFIVASYGAPDSYPTCGSGTAYLYVFEVGNATGFFDTNSVVEVADRKLQIGSGIPSSPRVTIASDPEDDMIFITTSDGQVLTIEPPLRSPPESSMIYWRQLF
jgi:Tfp pilus tip-associated adhesin PilY1